MVRLKHRERSHWEIPLAWRTLSLSVVVLAQAAHLVLICNWLSASGTSSLRVILKPSGLWAVVIWAPVVLRVWKGEGSGEGGLYSQCQPCWLNMGSAHREGALWSSFLSSQLPNLSPGHSPLKISFSKQPVRIVLITKGWGHRGEGVCPRPLPQEREGSFRTKGRVHPACPGPEPPCVRFVPVLLSQTALIPAFSLTFLLTDHPMHTHAHTNTHTCACPWGYPLPILIIQPPDVVGLPEAICHRGWARVSN